jgi:tape measure domain-containing protein
MVDTGGGRLGDVRVEVRADLDDLLRGFKRAETATRAFERDARKSADSTSKVTAESKELDRAMDRLKQSYAPLSSAAAKYRTELQSISRLEKAGRLNAIEAAGFRDKAASAYSAQSRSIKQATTSGAEFNAVLARTAGLLAAGFGTAKIKQFADAYTNFTNQLKVSGLEGEALSGVQQKLFDISIKYGTELNGLGTLYGRTAQAATELGASEAELLQLTTGVAAALKVQGGSSEAARGALLQLSQALGGGIVRAEEFNSIMEGARPIAQAVAAGIDRFGGSVSKLRNEIIAGKVTSQEFFQGFLKGSADLEAKAEKANLTIAQSFTILSNSLTKYIGEADKANGFSVALGAAIKGLADNVGILIPAVTVLAAAIGVHYVRGAIAATAATGGLAASMRVLAGNLVIGAVIVGLGYLAGKSAAAEIAFEQLGSQVDEARSSLALAEDRAKKAGVNISVLGDEAADAKDDILGIGMTLRFAAGEADRFANSAKNAAMAAATLRATKAESRVADIDRAIGSSGSATEKVNTFLSGLVRATGGGGGELDATRKRLQEERQAMQTIAQLSRREAKILGATPDQAFDKPAMAKPESPELVKHRETLADLEKLKVNASGQDLKTINRKIEREKKIVGYLEQGVGAEAATAAASGAGASAGKKRADTASQYASEMAQLMGLTLAAQLGLTTDLGERSDIEKQQIELAAQQRDTAIRANADYSAAQKEALLRQSAVLAQYEREAMLRDQSLATEQEKFELESAANQNLQALLKTTLALATNSTDRREVARRILKLQQSQELAELEKMLDDAIIAKDKKKQMQAQAAITLLAERQANEMASMERENAGPAAQYRDSLPRSANDIRDLSEQFGIDEFNRKLEESVSFANDIGSAFGNAAGELARFKNPLEVLKGLLGDIAATFTRMFIEQPITDWATQAIGFPAADALGGKGLDKAGAAIGLDTTQIDMALARASGNVDMLAMAAQRAATALGTTSAEGIIPLGIDSGKTAGALEQSVPEVNKFGSALAQAVSGLAGGGGGGGLLGLGLSLLGGALGGGVGIGKAGGGVMERAIPVPKFAGGGWIRGPGSGTSDSIDARVSDGEHITNAASARKFAPVLDGINSGRIKDLTDLRGMMGGRPAVVAGGDNFRFGDIHLHGVSDERQGRRSARQFASQVHEEIAQAKRRGY